MDTLSHGLWALAILWGTGYRWWAFFFGMISDLLSFGLFITQRILTGGFTMSRPPGMEIPSYVGFMYTITHSFFTWILIGVILYFVWRKYWPIVFAPIAHIALDIPTHNDFYPTPFLEPFFHYRYHGISWGTPWIWTLNWICLAIIFLLIWYHEWSKRRIMQGVAPSLTQTHPRKSR